ncbi:hypothetical protein [Komagataeibacter sp. FXV3]|uniref:hypothetical protein n=1 Tax=Komagataeibacter sp. FXV3 TaxID=2608998 RepID=UPI00187BB448
MTQQQTGAQDVHAAETGRPDVAFDCAFAPDVKTATIPPTEDTGMNRRAPSACAPLAKDKDVVVIDAEHGRLRSRSTNCRAQAGNRRVMVTAPAGRGKGRRYCRVTERTA